MEKKGIEGILLLLVAVQAVGVPAAKSLKGGLGAEDLPHLLEIVKEHQKIIDAVQAIDDIIPEAKDIDAAEAIIVVQKLIEVGKAIKEASKA